MKARKSKRRFHFKNKKTVADQIQKFAQVVASDHVTVARKATVSESSVIGDQSLLMSFSAANWASNSEAKSSGVTTLRTLSPPPHSPIRLFGIMAARQCPGLRRYVTIENSEMSAIGIGQGRQTRAS